jgi:HK97 family phage portal protein
LGLLDLFRREKALTATPAVVEAIQNGHTTYQRLGGTNQEVNAAWLQYQAATYAHMYRSQPAVRKVVDYIAWNVAQLGLKLYERVSDTDRRRDTDHPAALTVSDPDGQRPADQWLFTFIADFLINENAYALIFRRPGVGKRTLLRVPPPAVEVISSGGLLVSGYRIWLANGQTFPDRSAPPLPPEDIIHWCGYNPEHPRIGVSRLETLRQILAEDSASQRANVELLKAGLSKPGYIKRPLEAPDWSEQARTRFQESWANQAKSSPRKTPVLEEGMEFADFGISPKDAEMLAGRRFTNEEVASLYGLAHVPPEGDEERKAFYADVLPPITQSLASQFGFSLLTHEFAATDHYFEFDLNEKLRGEPEVRFSAITAAVGAPWLTRNEARALENKPPIEGGDDLVTPLNVLVGDNPRPAPNVMPRQDPNGPEQDGSFRERAIEPAKKALMAPRQAEMARRRDAYAEELKALLTRFYGRQERTFAKSARTQKAVPAARWEQWDSELADDLEALLAKTVEREGDVAAQRFGIGAFDTRLVRNYLRATAEDVAKSLNRKTREELAGAEAADVFARAKSERAPVTAMGLATHMATFAVKEAAKQTPDASNRVKTWVVTSTDSEHPEMDGETVPLGSTFSNGAEGPPADHPGCQCILEVT